MILTIIGLASPAAAGDLTLSCRKASGSPNIAERVVLALDRGGDVRIVGLSDYNTFQIKQWSDTAITFALPLGSGTLRGLYRVKAQMLHFTTLSPQSFDAKTTLLWGSLYCGEEAMS